MGFKGANLDRETSSLFFGMKNHQLSKPLGVILREADLVSAAQIEVALQDKILYEHLRIGEILALRGWLKSQTADFFAEEWPNLVKQKQKKPLGYYLKEAGLLNENQIKTILSKQKQGQTWIRFGRVVVLNGWLKQGTVDFFLENLSGKKESESIFISKRVLGSLKSEV